MHLARFAFSTSAFPRGTLKRALKRIAKSGFKGVELYADKPQLFLDSFAPRELERLKRLLDKLELFVSAIDASSVSGFWSDAPAGPLNEPSLIDRNRTLREWRVAYTKKALRLARALGAQCVTVGSGHLQNGVPPERAQRLLEESLRRVLDEAVQTGARLAILPEPGALIETVGEAKALLQSVEHPNLGVALDAGRLALAGESLARAGKLFGTRLLHVTFADHAGHKYYPLIPGTGELPFAHLFGQLDSAGYTGPLTLCLPTCAQDPESAVRQSHRTLHTLLAPRKAATRRTPARKLRHARV